MKIKTDKSKEYESNRFIYYFTIPVMFLVAKWVKRKKEKNPQPETNSFFFDGLSKKCRKIKEAVTARDTVTAMDLVDNHHFSTENGVIDGIITHFWFGLMKNARALRNRKKLNKKIFKKNLTEKLKNLSKEETVDILIVGPGTGQVLIDSLKEDDFLNDERVNIVLLDKYKIALDEVQRRISEHDNLRVSFEFLNEDVFNINPQTFSNKFDIIEMVGVFEYFPENRQVVEQLNALHELLKDGGCFITTNVTKDLEKYVLYYVINWPSKFRSTDEMAEILQETPFEHCEATFEPLKTIPIYEIKKL